MSQILHICQSCLGTDTAKPPSDRELAALQAKFIAADMNVTVARVDCLNVCDAPAAISLQAADKASYVFSGIDITADAEDIVATCKAHAKAEMGWITDASECGRLRFCLVARLPSLKTD